MTKDGLISFGKYMVDTDCISPVANEETVSNEISRCEYTSVQVDMMDDDLVGELQCPVCLELFTWPIILPCSHILCRDPCAERLFAHGFIRCPVCRDNSFVSGGIQNLPRVISLEHIIERVRHPTPQPLSPVLPSVDDFAELSGSFCGPDDIACQLCDIGLRPARRAVKSCLHCNASYCSQCLKASHPNRSPFNDHRLIEPRRQTTPDELRCLQHDAMVNMFCDDCQALGCLLCAPEDEHSAHTGHRILPLTQAADFFKGSLQDGLKNMERSQVVISESLTSYQTMLAELQHCVDTRRAVINDHCDGLVNEIETKREFFLSDLEYEERSKRECLMNHIENLSQESRGVQSLVQYANAVLRETDPCAFIQLAKSITEKATKHHQKMTPSSAAATTCTVKLNQKTIDFRKEKAVIRDLAYLVVPDTPQIDVSRCSRSTSSVVLVLCAPTQEGDVIDGYRVFFSTDREQPPETWEVLEFKTPGEARRCGRNVPSDSAICLMHNNLSSDTVYYFAVIAHNTAGSSQMSEVVHCHTLSQSQSTLSVPTIIENQCRTYTYSIQLHSPSPLNYPVPCQSTDVAFYLLFREASVNKIWKSISLYGRVDHRVFGLEPDTLYDFVIMACDKNSECQVSNMITLRTERSAY